jgi:hypothetical protein
VLRECSGSSAGVLGEFSGAADADQHARPGALAPHQHRDGCVRLFQLAAADMYACLYIHIYIYICMHMCVYICVYICIHMYTHTRTHTRMHVPAGHSHSARAGLQSELGAIGCASQAHVLAFDGSVPYPSAYSRRTTAALYIIPPYPPG